MNTELTALLDELSSVLEAELGHYAELTALALKEQSVLVNGKVAELAAIVSSIEAVTVRIRAGESRRVEVIERFREHLPLAGDHPTLSQLVSHLPEPEKTRFRALQEQLVGAMKEIHYLNEYNASLVKHSLEYTNYLLSLFTADGSARKAGLYRADGGVNQGENLKLLDRQA